MNTSQIDTRQLRNALGSFTTGVTVVTTHGTSGRDVGLTANSFSSVSLEPPLVLWSLGKSALSLRDFQEAEYFAVHILAEAQRELSNRFATRGADKFENLTVTRGPGNIPLLADCTARFVCKTTYQYEGGDHIILVGEVTEFTHFDERPLLFHGGQYAQLLKNTAPEAAHTRDFENASLGFLLRYCAHKLLEELKAELSRHDLTPAQYYFLALLAKEGEQSFEKALAAASQGDTPPSPYDIDNLFERGYLNIDADTVSLTPAGSRIHVELVAFYKAAETTALDTLDYDMQQTLHIALGRVAASLSNKGA